jgi:hypothetical protein
MTSETNKFTYQSRLIYESVLSTSLQRCLRERVDNPNAEYINSVKALALAMPTRIKKEYTRWVRETINDKDIISKSDDTLEFLLACMEKNNLLIPQKSIPRGGGYR